MYICIVPQVSEYAILTKIKLLRQIDKEFLKELKRKIYETEEHVQKIINECGLMSDCLNAAARVKLQTIKYVLEKLGIPYHEVEVRSEKEKRRVESKMRDISDIFVENEYELKVPLPPWF